jgi:hypothetical protein
VVAIALGSVALWTSEIQTIFRRAAARAEHEFKASNVIEEAQAA